MSNINNIEEINKRYCRELGNEVIKEISRYVQDNISDEYVFVRWSKNSNQEIKITFEHY